jgi:hypothetical protein
MAIGLMRNASQTLGHFPIPHSATTFSLPQSSFHFNPREKLKIRFQFALRKIKKKNFSLSPSHTLF